MDGKRQRIHELEALTSETEFWADNERAQRVMREINSLRSRVETWEGLQRRVSDLRDLVELAEEDPEFATEVKNGVREAESELEALEFHLLLSGEYDDHDALVAVHAGTGGVDAQDWAEMLVRMYTRWAETRGFGVQLLDRSEGDEAGIKGATLEISGENAYGYLKGEAGTHRLVRLSPFDAANRRHTAFSLVEVLPVIEDDLEVDINDEDIRVDTYRASGAGGQHVNKTSSAVRITHIPTGIVVTCQDERSQTQNRMSAMKILRSRLLEKKLRERDEAQAELKGDLNVEGWGSRIRSYVLQPYTMVTDHRSDFSTGNVQGVLNGDLDPLIDAYLHLQMGEAEQVSTEA